MAGEEGGKNKMTPNRDLVAWAGSCGEMVGVVSYGDGTGDYK